MDSTLLGPTGFTLATEEQSPAGVKRAARSSPRGSTHACVEHLHLLLSHRRHQHRQILPAKTHAVGLFLARLQNHNVELRTFREAAGTFSSLGSFDELGALRGIGRLAQQVLAFVLRAAVLQEQHARRHNHAQTTGSSCADVNSSTSGGENISKSL